jgi:peptidoglycan/LPS O-acetylase OafA/YrhL
MIKPLTSLRAFAALYVLFFHSGSQFLIERGILTGWAQNFALNGYLGVSFFFILSGFILQHVYEGRVEDGAQRTDFARARFARIYPVYLLALLMTATFAFEADLSAIPQFFMLHLWNVPALGAPDNWNFPSWTLSVELLFYICFIPLSLVVLRLGTRQMVAGLAIVAAVMIALNGPAVMGPALEADAAFHNMVYQLVPVPVLRLPEFLFGILLRRAITLHGPDAARAQWTFLVSGIVMLGVLAVDHAIWTANVFALCAGAMTWALPQMGGSAAFRLLSARALVVLGASSYSLYILQFPVRKWMRLADIWPHPMVERLAYYPILILFSIAVYYLFEEKLRNVLRKDHKPPAAIG